MKTKFQLALQLTFIVIGTLFLVAVAAHGQFMMLNVSGPSDGSGPVVACGAAQFDFSDACNVIFFTGAMRP